MYLLALSSVLWLETGLIYTKYIFINFPYSHHPKHTSFHAGYARIVTVF